jgi:NAD(P)-dependent dehydrogenase (short-subunit alcohol dehydrogenase family)
MTGIELTGLEGKVAYPTSKAGLHALTACMAQEVGKHGIRVNAVCPGIVDTARMDDIPRGQVWDEMIRT